ncbi:MAG: hypothetical protein KF911_14075 [Pseudomonadales bacterium]|nr:hypothetical protein [Pseudomonadales bacterium]
MRWRAALILLAAIACSVAPPAPEVRFHPREAYPARLSDWGILVRAGDRYLPGAGSRPYEIRAALFSDYALKLRTLYVPPGSRIGFRPDGPLELPVGSIVSKTFFYPVQKGHAVAAEGWSGDPAELRVDRHRVLETRLLVRQADGWDALPYVWDGDDAYLRVTGALARLPLAVDGTTVDLAYVVPSRNECAGCHATDHASGALEPIGLQARHLNRAYPGATTGQLVVWAADGLLDGLPDAVPATADWRDPATPLAERARAYLDINCGHCHRPHGPAATSGLFLDAATTDLRQLGVCKRPIAAGRGSGGHHFSILPGRPDASILTFRMRTSDPAMRMPELGRTLVHTDAVALLEDWIASLPGTCL